MLEKYNKVMKLYKKDKFTIERGLNIINNKLSSFIEKKAMMHNYLISISANNKVAVTASNLKMQSRLKEKLQVALLDIDKIISITRDDLLREEKKLKLIEHKIDNLSEKIHIAIKDNTNLRERAEIDNYTVYKNCSSKKNG